MCDNQHRAVCPLFFYSKKNELVMFLWVHSRAVVFRYESDQIFVPALILIVTVLVRTKKKQQVGTDSSFLQAYRDENLLGQLFTTSKLALYHLCSSRFDGLWALYRHCSLLESVRFLRVILDIPSILGVLRVSSNFRTSSTPSIRVLVA